MIYNTGLISYLCHRQCVRIIISARPMSYVSKLLRSQPQNCLIDKEKYKIVYDFPTIKHCANVFRLKYSFPIYCLIASPLAFAFEKSLFLLGFTGAVGLINVGLLLALTKFLTNSVGKVYVNKEGDIEELLISFLDKSGRRQDLKLSPNELIVLDPLTKMQAAFGVVPLLVKDSNTIFKLYLPKSTICDNETFEKLFGKENLKKTKLKHH